MAEKEHLNILIVCEHASNRYGGEAVLPLNYFLGLSNTHHQVYLLTHERAKLGIENIPDINHRHIFYIPDTWLHRILNKIGRTLPHQISVVTVGAIAHLITQVYQFWMVRSIVQTKQIDVIHEPAPVSPRQPSMLFGFGKPVLIGPMNGGMAFPEAFQYMTGRFELGLYGLVRGLTDVYNLLIPGKLFATTLLVANKRTEDALPLVRFGKIVQLVENGVYFVKDTPRELAESPHIQVLFVGRLIALKALDIVIDALEICRSKVTLNIVGDGQERIFYQRYAEAKPHLDIRFLGQVPHEQVAQHYDKADIFVLPSLRECGGAVVLEAMSRGVPVIATDWGGPADYVTPETGFLVEPKSREHMVSAFAQYIDELASDPQKRYNMGLAGIQRIKQEYMWDSKIETMIKHYQEAIQRYHA